MDHTSLAQRFNEATDALGPLGHGVIVRRARALLGEGDVGSVVTFLREASRRQGLTALGDLAGAVEAWQRTGASPTELRRTPAWQQGQARGEAVATRIESLTGAADLDGLIEALVAEQSAQAALPDAPAAQAAGPKPLASIFGQVEKPAASAVVEADSHLVSVPLDLDDEPVRRDPPRRAERPVVGASVEPPARPAARTAEAPRSVGDRPTSAPPMPLATPSTAPPARRAANTASVPLPPEAVEELPTLVSEPAFTEPSAPPAPVAVMESAPPPPAEVPAATPPTQVTAPATGNGTAYWVALGLLVLAAVIWLAFR